MTFGGVFWLNVLWFIGGIAFWLFLGDKIHTFLVGAEVKVQQLRERARALEAKIRGN